MTDLTALINQALVELGDRATRREKVFAVAQIYHRNKGVLPTIAVTRQHVVKGSYTDIGHDLKDFGETVSTKKERLISAPGMPEDLGIQINDLVNQLWLASTTKAAQDFEAEKAELRARNDELTSKSVRLESERLQALNDRSDAIEALASEQKQVSSFKAAVSDLERHVSDLKSTVSKLEARLGEMETEKIRTQEKHAAELQGLAGTLKERENRILDLQGIAATLKAGYEEKIATAMALENEHRIRANQAEQSRGVVQEALEATNNELANLRGQFAGMTSRIDHLEASRHDSVGQLAILGHELESEKSRNQQLSDKNAVLKTDAHEKEKTIASLQGRVADLESKIFAQKR